MKRRGYERALAIIEQCSNVPPSIPQLRRALLTDPACRSVHDAAEHLGITELGRMANQYRHWFGELPSESLTGRALPPRLLP